MVLRVEMCQWPLQAEQLAGCRAITLTAGLQFTELQLHRAQSPSPSKPPPSSLKSIDFLSMISQEVTDYPAGTLAQREGGRLELAWIAGREHPVGRPFA